MTSDKTGARRQYNSELKAQVVAECDAPGASVAKVAMSHGINANIVHRWRQLARDGKPLAVAHSRGFMALPFAASAAPATAHQATSADIRVEIKRSAITLTITWPTSAAADFALWTRELLR